MKILITQRAFINNPFVGTLAQALTGANVDVTCSISELWTNWKNYDIIHFQWPEYTLGKGRTISNLRALLSAIKSEKKIVISTVHNIEPHNSNDDSGRICCEMVYECTDSFVHMGKYSFELFREKYSNARHCLIPHHIYDTIYKPFESSAIAYKRLHLSSYYRYILCLGAFRNGEERDMINKLAKRMAPDGYKIIAPSFYLVQGSRYQYRCLYLLKVLCCKILLLINTKLVAGRRYVPISEIPYYYSISDIILIQRKKILNSGNLPMGFLFGKVVVGPDVGNVGMILRETGNPTFQPDDITTLVDAIKKAIALRELGHGLENQRVAYQTMSTEIVARQYKSLYEDLFRSRSF